MGAVVQANATTGKTLYFQIWDFSGEIWNTSGAAFEAYQTANRTDYDVAMTEQGTASGHYNGTFPGAIAAGSYNVEVFERAGGSPAEGDTLIGGDKLDWDGSDLVEYTTGFSTQQKADVNAEVDAALDTAIPGGPTANSINERIAAIDDKLPSKSYLTGTSNSDGDPQQNEFTGDFSATAIATIYSECDTALSDIGLDHLLSTSVAGGDIADDSVVAQLVSSAATADWDTFDNKTDSLEALADEAAQTIRSGTAQAGADDSITLDAGASATDDLYNGTTVVLTGNTGAGQSRVILDYDGTTKVATVSPDWADNPDNTTEFEVRPFGQAALIALGLDATALANMSELYQGVVQGTVTDASPADDEFDGDAGLSATDDKYNGGTLVFTSGTLTGEARKISDYDGTAKTFTFDGSAGSENTDRPFSAAPANGDTFVILGVIGT